jgi:spoIIIJ-associated protein
MTNENPKIKKSEIEKIIKEFFEKMTFEVEFETGQLKENTLPLSLKTTDPQILIGEHGQTLIELQKVLGKILRRKLGQDIFFDLDINQYKKNKIEYLKELAQSVADEVSLEKKEKALSPMPSYERRIIHLTLAEREDVITESVGKEPERRVVVKPR